MTDVIKRAQDLVEAFDGQLRDWTTVGDDEHRTVRIDDFNRPATEIEYEYIRCSREYFDIIKGLLGEVEQKRCNPDWKPVSELQNMTYEEAQKMQAENKGKIFLISRGKKIDREFFVFRCRESGVKSKTSEQAFADKKLENEHVYFVSLGYNNTYVFPWSNAKHILFDETAPEEE